MSNTSIIYKPMTTSNLPDPRIPVDPEALKPTGNPRLDKIYELVPDRFEPNSAGKPLDAEAQAYITQHGYDLIAAGEWFNDYDSRILSFLKQNATKFLNAVKLRAARPGANHFDHRLLADLLAQAH